jgi:hypothetical protein
MSLNWEVGEDAFMYRSSEVVRLFDGKNRYSPLRVR